MSRVQSTPSWQPGRSEDGGGGGRVKLISTSAPQFRDSQEKWPQQQDTGSGWGKTVETENNYSTFRVSESDRRFFEQFGLLSQSFKERDLLQVDSQSSEPSEEGLGEGCVPVSCPGMTWDGVSYTNIFKFNQDLEKNEVRNAFSLPRRGLACLVEMFTSARETLRRSFVYHRE